jgi:phytoene/squalene synthetase
VIEAAREPFARLIEASDARHFTWLYADEAAREHLELFFALESELLATVQPALDHSVAHARLTWWQGEAERAAAGTPVHPIMVSLAARRAAAGLPTLDIRPLVATLAWDLAGAPCPTERELTTYTGAWARSYFAPLCELLLPEASAQRPVALSLGAAIRELELLALVHGDPTLAGLRVPSDALGQFGLQHESLADRPLRPPAYDLLAARHAAARRALADAVSQVPAATQPAWRPVLVWSYCAYQDSRAAVTALPAAPNASALARFGRTIQTWRAALRAASGQFALPR